MALSFAAVALGACWSLACSGSDPVPGGEQPNNLAGSTQAGSAGGPGGSAGSGGATPTGGGGASAGSVSTGGAAAGSGGTPSTSAGMGGSGGSSTSGAGGGGGSGGESQPITCPSAALPPGDTNKKLDVGGSSRDYLLHVPQTYDGSKAVPLVIDFHPLSGNGGGWRNTSPYPAQTDPEGVIVAYPSGKAGPSGGAWDVGPCCVSGVDDVAFAKAMVSEISNVACIDPKRVYAVGFSMGGGMSHYLACKASDVFAAVAPAAFDLLEENVGDCKPSRPLSIISYRGTDDGLVFYDGGYSAVVPGMPITFLGAQSTFEKWAELNECTGAPSAKDAKGCSTYSTCKAGVEVTLCTAQGGGHAAANASTTWPLLKKHKMP